MNLTLPINLQEGHNIEAVAVGCFDGRMRRQFMMFFEIYLCTDNFFPLDFPGGSKIINEHPDFVIPTFFSTPVEKCGSKRIVILDHEDCLAWGGSSAFSNKDAEKDFHVKQLHEAKENIHRVYPEIDIKLFYAQFAKNKREQLLLHFKRVK